MTKKIFSFVLLGLMFTFSLVGVGVSNVSAAEAFPSGCGSALGYSVTTGQPCNRSVDNAIIGFMPGCTSAIGYSVTNGAACSGGVEVLNYLSGCTSVYGYSVYSGTPCNGTNAVTLLGQTPATPTTPGLPTTGAGGNSLLNNVLLAISGAVAILGLGYLSRKQFSSK